MEMISEDPGAISNDWSRIIGAMIALTVAGVSLLLCCVRKRGSGAISIKSQHERPTPVVTCYENCDVQQARPQVRTLHSADSRDASLVGSSHQKPYAGGQVGEESSWPRPDCRQPSHGNVIVNPQHVSSTLRHDFSETTPSSISVVPRCSSEDRNLDWRMGTCRGDDARTFPEPPAQDDVEQTDFPPPAKCLTLISDPGFALPSSLADDLTETSMLPQITTMRRTTECHTSPRLPGKPNTCISVEPQATDTAIAFPYVDLIKGCEQARSTGERPGVELPIGIAQLDYPGSVDSSRDFEDYEFMQSGGGPDQVASDFNDLPYEAMQAGPGSDGGKSQKVDTLSQSKWNNQGLFSISDCPLVQSVLAKPGSGTIQMVASQSNVIQDSDSDDASYENISENVTGSYPCGQKRKSEDGKNSRELHSQATTVPCTSVSANEYEVSDYEMQPGNSRSTSKEDLEDGYEELDDWKATDATCADRRTAYPGKGSNAPVPEEELTDDDIDYDTVEEDTVQAEDEYQYTRPGTLPDQQENSDDDFAYDTVVRTPNGRLAFGERREESTSASSAMISDVTHQRGQGGRSRHGERRATFRVFPMAGERGRERPVTELVVPIFRK